jgi:hypothetical protein
MSGAPSCAPGQRPRRAARTSLPMGHPGVRCHPMLPPNSMIRSCFAPDCPLDARAERGGRVRVEASDGV